MDRVKLTVTNSSIGLIYALKKFLPKNIYYKKLKKQYTGNDYCFIKIHIRYYIQNHQIELIITIVLT